jgi:hypothetical protein
MSARAIEITIAKESELEDVRRIARTAQAQSLRFKVVVLYRPPSSRVLDRWRRITPGEFRWRIHGATAAEALAARAREVAYGEGVRAETEILYRAS